MPSFPETIGMRAGAVAAYPMYRGLAKLVGMTVLKTGMTFEEEIATLREHWDAFDFMFVHYKPADSAGEDGDFDRKVQALEAFDKHVEALHDLQADVLMIAGDHSTPAVLAGHSWHPVPFLLHAKWQRGDEVDAFQERACRRGSLGTFPAMDVMPLAMAHARRLAKYGA
jgi:2,3-bisphosphoglycerate-independent phosphoglycerate mutase